MGSSPWWVWLLPLPWVVAVAWAWLRTGRADDSVPPSLGELARRRLRSP